MRLVYINRAAKWHHLNNRGCNPRSTINRISQPWMGWILTGMLSPLFNPSGVASEFSCLYRGLHPRLFKLNPFGVNTSNLIKKLKNGDIVFNISYLKITI